MRFQPMMSRIEGGSRQRGFGLVELMVAVALSLFLLAGVVAVFMSSRKSYETGERLSRIQENGRFALEQLVDDLRAAGYQGCAKPNTATTRAQDYAITTLASPMSLAWNFSLPVQGFDTDGSGTWTPALDTVIATPPATAPANASDVIVLRVPRRDAVPMRLTSRQATGADPLIVGTVTPPPVAAGDVVMISDCAARAWFQVTSYAAGAIAHEVGGLNASASLLHPFDLAAEIVPVETVIYYIAPSTAGPALTSLWKKTATSAGVTAAELAEGIERFEIQYGVDSAGNDGRVDQYVDADAVTNWANAISVRVALLARSSDAYGNDLDNRQYTLLDSTAPVGPFNDRFQRQVFSTTVALRNQVID